MEPLPCQSKQSFSLSNFKISKEVTITKYNKNENNIMSMLKKLPNITFGYASPQPSAVFKVSDTPKRNKNNYKTSIAPKSVFSDKNITSNNETKIISEKKVLSDRREVNIIIDTKPSLIDNVENLKKIKSNSKKTSIQKQKKIYNNILLEKNNSNKTIINSSEAVSEKCSEKENNVQRLNSHNKIFKKSHSVSNTKSKTTKLTKKIVYEKKNKLDKDSTINNMKVKTNTLVMEKCLLMDISIKDKINIIQAYRSLDFTNFCNSENHSFVKGISMSSENEKHLETFKNDIAKESLNGQELSELTSPTTPTPISEMTHFSQISSYIKISLNTNISNSMHTDLDSGSYSTEENVTLLDSIKNEQFPENHTFRCIKNKINKLENDQKQKSNLYFYNDIFNKPLVQNNETNFTKNTHILLKNFNQLLQKPRRYICENLDKNTIKNECESKNFTKPLQEILGNNKHDFSNFMRDENNYGIKRFKQQQIELYKKQKIDNENV